MIYIAKELFNVMLEHAREEFPNECCGIVVGKDKIVKKIYPMTNIDKSPESFFMDPKEQLKVMKEIRDLNLEMLGIYHSHVASEAYPSLKDRQLAFYPQASYLIISLKDINNPQMRSFKIKEEIEEEDIVILKNILFVCVENSCRSQIAEGLVNYFYKNRFFAYSAGSKPSGIVNPLAIEVMREIGIDISQQKSKGFKEIKGIDFDYVVTLGCGDVCPVYPAKNKINWQIEDPKNKPIDFFRRTRDEIKRKIEELIDEDCSFGNKS